jgi:hypothetical protein
MSRDMGLIEKVLVLRFAATILVGGLAFFFG